MGYYIGLIRLIGLIGLIGFIRLAHKDNRANAIRADTTFKVNSGLRLIMQFG